MSTERYSIETAYEKAIEACLAWKQFKLGLRSMYECDDLTEAALEYHKRAAEVKDRKVA